MHLYSTPVLRMTSNQEINVLQSRASPDASGLTVDYDQNNQALNQHVLSLGKLQSIALGLTAS